MVSGDPFCSLMNFSRSAIRLCAFTKRSYSSLYVGAMDMGCAGTWRQRRKRRPNTAIIKDDVTDLSPKSQFERKKISHQTLGIMVKQIRVELFLFVHLQLLCGADKIFYQVTKISL